MKKLTLILSLLLAVACMATACADNSDVEPPNGSGVLGDTTDPEVGSPADSVAETESETSPAENSR